MQSPALVSPSGHRGTRLEGETASGDLVAASDSPRTARNDSPTASSRVDRHRFPGSLRPLHLPAGRHAGAVRRYKLGAVARPNRQPAENEGDATGGRTRGRGADRVRRRACGAAARAPLGPCDVVLHCVGRAFASGSFCPSTIAVVALVEYASVVTTLGAAADAAAGEPSITASPASARIVPSCLRR